MRMGQIARQVGVSREAPLQLSAHKKTEPGNQPILTAQGRAGRIAASLLRLDLVILDELGYLPFSQAGGALLFHLLSRLTEFVGKSLITNDAQST